MKILSPAKSVFGPLFALLCLASFASAPAQAQSGWQLDHYECSGTTQYSNN